MSKVPNIKVLAAMTGVVLVGGLGATFYQYSSMGEVRARVETLKKKADHEKELSKQADETAKKLKESQEHLAHLEEGVPKVAYVPTLLKELQAVGESHGISVLGVRPLMIAEPKKSEKDQKGTSDRKAYDELRIEVKGRGKFTAVQSFLEAMKSFPKIVAARTVTATPKMDPNRKTAENLDVTIELKTYVFAEMDKSKKGSETSVKPKPEVTVKNG